MKKLICVVALCLAAPLTFADEASVQMVLDSVHSKGFVGCDDKIRERYERGSFNHVEVKMPLFVGEGRNSVALEDEIIVIVGFEGAGNNHNGWQTGSINSDIFRKVGRACVSVRGFSIKSNSNDCRDLANFILSPSSRLLNADGSLWGRLDMGMLEKDPVWRNAGATEVFTPISGGGCRQITLPEDRSNWRKQ